MKHRSLLIVGVLLVGIAVLVAWIARNTRWEEVKLSTPLRGEALSNPHYALQKLVSQLGAHSTRENLFAAPDPGDVIYLTNWNWDLAEGRRRQLEQWVESGGRLVTDTSVFVYDDEHFFHWSGIRQVMPQLAEDKVRARRRLAEEGCMELEPRGQSFMAGDRGDRSLVVCGFSVWSAYETVRPILWALRDEVGMQALRVPVGEGSLTVLAATPFARRALLQEDHAALFVTAAQLRAGDHLHILSEEDFPSLAALAWRFGWPVTVLLALALLLALWRRAARFGPRLPPAVPARRSLAEQIRGVGRFAMRHGGGHALHAASRRALERAARRRIPGFDQLKGAERGEALARAARLDAPDLQQAMNPSADAGPRVLVAAITQLETVRRRISYQPTGHVHGR